MGKIIGKRTDGPISRHINRKFSSRITSFILKYNIPVTPNQVSLISFLTAVVGALLYLWRLDPVAGILVQLASIVDGVDGELARARNMASPVGAFLDSLLDRIADAFVISMLTLTAFWMYGWHAFLIGIVALFGSLMVSYIHAQGVTNLKVAVSEIGKVRTFASRDVRLFIVFLGSIFFRPLETLIVLAIITHSYYIPKMIDVYLYYRKRD